MCLRITLGGNHGTGHFYLAKNRTFLLCVDRIRFLITRVTEHAVRSHRGYESRLHHAHLIHTTASNVHATFLAAIFRTTPPPGRIISLRKRLRLRIKPHHRIWLHIRFAVPHRPVRCDRNAIGIRFRATRRKWEWPLHSSGSLITQLLITDRCSLFASYEPSTFSRLTLYTYPLP
jgi:hypothetical protein